MQVLPTFDLEERLVHFSCRITDLADALPKTRAGNYLSGQLVRAGLSPAFNYGEAQAAESRYDFVHKLALVLKELKTCRVTMKIVRTKQLIQPVEALLPLYRNGEELIAIVTKCILAAKESIRKSA
jgi:four helix bundle protein